MPNLEWIIAAGIVIGIIAGVIAWRPWRSSRRRGRLVQARRDFHLQRERLECFFFQLAADSGRPRGLRWVDCDFDDAVTYACDRVTGELSALVGVTIRFEAIEGGGMEHNPNVSNRRAATAVFRFDGQKWTTTGRAIFNLNPVEAIEHFRDSLVMVGQEAAQRS